MSEFQPSEYQQAIFDKIEHTNESLIIEAVAGSGKTTTIVHGVELMPVNEKITFLAFNKAIAQELAERLPDHCQAKTFHALGLASWLRFVGGRRNLSEFIDGNKMTKIVRDDLNLSPNETRIYFGFVLKLVSLAKNAGMSYLMKSTPEAWRALVDHFDLSLDSEDATLERGIEIARAAITQSVKVAGEVIDFDDMLFMPLVRNCTFVKNDVVLVDEAQDTNGVQQALLKRMLKPDGRLIAVGDSCQAIYGFRGADSEAMNRIAEDFKCVKLPLTVSYRCPKQVVKKAQEVVSHIEAHESAPEGGVKVMGQYFEVDFQPQDAIICRNVAPLIDFAYGLISRGIGCQVLGREIGKGLIKLIKKLNAQGIERLTIKLDAWRERETKEANLKNQEAKVERINDTADCLIALIKMLPETSRTIPALIAKINALFSDDSGNNSLVTLCSVHKSKGLEWSTVYVLDADELMPSKYARKDWQKTQERNLIYVAYTRAKNTLRFINSGMWGAQK